MGSQKSSSAFSLSVDAVNGVTITQLSHSDFSVTVQIDLDSSCTSSEPVVEISPTIREAAPGASVVYTVAIANKDSANCGASSFALNAALPDGWSGMLSPDSLDVLAGQTGQASFSVTSVGPK